MPRSKKKLNERIDSDQLIDVWDENGNPIIISGKVVEKEKDEKNN